MVRPSHPVVDMPPSAKLVYKVLEYEDGTLTQQQIADETLLPKRTVRFALSRLNDENVVDGRVSFRDARQSVYSLAEPEPATEAE